MRRLGWRKLYGARRRHYFIIEEGENFARSLCGDYLVEINPHDFYSIEYEYNPCLRCKRKLTGL